MPDAGIKGHGFRDSSHRTRQKAPTWSIFDQDVRETPTSLPVPTNRGVSRNRQANLTPRSHAAQPPCRWGRLVAGVGATLAANRVPPPICQNTRFETRGWPIQARHPGRSYFEGRPASPVAASPNEKIAPSRRSRTWTPNVHIVLRGLTVALAASGTRNTIRRLARDQRLNDVLAKGIPPRPRSVPLSLRGCVRFSAR
jgi:hypothetical protein